jgi:hypothetical protein
MLEVIGVLFLFAWAMWLCYKIGRVDGISYTIDWLEKKGLIKFDPKVPKKNIS